MNRKFLKSMVFLRGNRGSALLNVVVVSAVLGGLTYVMNQRLQSSMKLARRGQVGTYRDQIALNINNALGDTYSLQTTARRNGLMQSCVYANGTNTPDCTGCTRAQIRAGANTADAGTCWRRMILYTDNSGNPSDTDLSDDEIVAGPTNFYYTTTGQRGCVRDNSDAESRETCAFLTEVQYAIQCPLRQLPNGTFVDTVSCDRADKLFFRYRVFDGRTGTGYITEIGLGQTPPMKEYTDFRYAKEVLVSDIEGTDECPAGAIGHGFGSNQQMYHADNTQFRGVGYSGDGSVGARGEVACKCVWETSNSVTEVGKRVLRQQLRYNDRGQPYNCNEVLENAESSLGVESECRSDQNFRGYRFERSGGRYVRRAVCGIRSTQVSVPVSPSEEGPFDCGGYTSGGGVSSYWDFTRRVTYLRVSSCWVRDNGRIECDGNVSGRCNYRQEARK